MSVIFDSVASGTTTTSPLTFNETVATGDDRAMYIGVIARFTGSGTIDSVDFNGDAATLINAIQVGSALGAAIYRLEAPDTGTHTVTIAVSGTLTALFGVAWAFQGADQTSSVWDKDKSSGTGSNHPTVAPGCPADSYVVTVMGAARLLNAITATIDGGATEDANIQAGVAAGAAQCAASHDVGDSGATSEGWTLDRNVDNVICGVAVAPMIRTLALTGCGR